MTILYRIKRLFHRLCKILHQLLWLWSFILEPERKRYNRSTKIQQYMLLWYWKDFDIQVHIKCIASFEDTVEYLQSKNPELHVTLSKCEISLRHMLNFNIINRNLTLTLPKSLPLTIRAGSSKPRILITPKRLVSPLKQFWYTKSLSMQ